MPRSSGQKAMPSRAILSEESCIDSAALNCTDPLRFATMPMIDLSVVVLPAPLRPSSVTTSPSRTSKSMPCRMCDSPYQACRSFTRRRASGTEVRLLHAGIGGDGRIVALRKDLAALQDGDAVRERGDHRQVVLDHQHGAVRRRALDEGGDALDIAVRHARGRLIEQH